MAKNNNDGCIQGLLILGGAIVVLFLANAVMEGIGKIILSIPWYGYTILLIVIIIIAQVLNKPTK